MFRIAIQLIRLVRKHYSYDSDVIYFAAYDFYWSDPNDLLRIKTYIIMPSVQFRYVLCESQAGWRGSGGSAIFYNMLEKVPNPPVPYMDGIMHK